MRALVLREPSKLEHRSFCLSVFRSFCLSVFFCLAVLLSFVLSFFLSAILSEGLDRADRQGNLKFRRISFQNFREKTKPTAKPRSNNQIPISRKATT